MVNINEIVEIVEIREHDEQVILQLFGITFIETNDHNKLENRGAHTHAEIDAFIDFYQSQPGGFSGDYNDLANKPAIPDQLSDLAADATHRTVTDADKTTWNGKSDFTGNYADLSGKPAIPENLSDLAADATHRTVTDADKTNWNNKADLDTGGKIPATQLPSYVDDVLEYANSGLFPATGESGKIYIAQNENLTYRWSGTGYAEISQSLALGETSSTAYRGDRGKTGYDHSQATGNPHGLTKTDIGLGNVENTSDADKPISTAAQSALDGKSATGHNHNLNDLAEKNYSSLAGKPTIPAALADLTADSTHRTVTDSEKDVWNIGNPRLAAIADGTSISVNADTTDMATQNNTQAAGTLTVNNPSGVPASGKKIVYRIKCTNAQTFSWGSNFRGSTDAALPTSHPGGGKTNYYGVMYNSADSKYDYFPLTSGF